MLVAAEPEVSAELDVVADVVVGAAELVDDDGADDVADVVADDVAEDAAGDIDVAALLVGAGLWPSDEQPTRPATAATHPTETLTLRFMRPEGTGVRVPGSRTRGPTRRCS